MDRIPLVYVQDGNINVDTLGITPIPVEVQNTVEAEIVR